MNIQYQNDDEQTLSGTYSYYSPLINQEPEELQPIVPTDSTQTPRKQIVHKVIYGDTLEGLSLTYDVPISRIKDRNKIDSDSIYFLKQIIIPNSRLDQAITREQEQFMKVQEFMFHMSPIERQPKSARYYLSENGWDVQKAVAEYRQDLQWQKTHKITSVPFQIHNPLHTMKKKTT